MSANQPTETGLSQEAIKKLHQGVREIQKGSGFGHVLVTVKNKIVRFVEVTEREELRRPSHEAKT